MSNEIKFGCYSNETKSKEYMDFFSDEKDFEFKVGSKNEKNNLDFNSLNISKLDIFNEFNSNKEKEGVLPKSIKEQKKQIDNDKITSKMDKKGTSWLFDEIVNNNHIIRISGMIHVYREEFGFYELIKDSDLDRFIRSESPRSCKKYINSGIVRETIMWMKAEKSLEIDIDNADIDSTKYINFRNGFYDIRGKQLLKHSYTQIFTSYIDCDYKKNIDFTNSEFFKYLIDVSMNDKKTIYQIQELIGVAISNYREFKKAFFLVGPPNSGKSTTLELLMNLIGKRFCSNVNLHDLNNKFRLAGLAGKKLNAVGEISEIDLNRLDVFKSVSGNDYIEAEFKGKDPFTFKNKAMLIFGGNNLPNLKVEDATGAFYKRINIIVFKNGKKPSEINYDLLENLLNERDIIVRVGIEGLLRLMNNNFKFTESEASLDLKEYTYNKINSFKLFLDEKCVSIPNSKISRDDLKWAYHNYCEDKSIEIISDNEWKSIIRNTDWIVKKKISVNGVSVNGFEGIAIR